MPYRQYFPEVFNVSTLLRPLVWIKPAQQLSYYLEIDSDYQPLDVLPGHIWNKRVDEVDKKIQSCKSKEFDSFEAAYSFVWSKLNSFPVFDPKKISSDPTIEWDKTTGAVVGKNSMRFYLNYATNTDLESLHLEWVHFWKLNEQYQEHPNHFYYAYEWIANHPMFWILKGDPQKDNKLYWETNDTFNIAWHSVFYHGPSKSVTHQFELGPNMCASVKFPTGEVSCIPQSVPSLDTNLDVQEDTYEEAVISLAKKVNKYYPLSNMESWIYAGCPHRPDNA